MAAMNKKTEIFTVQPISTVATKHSVQMTDTKAKSIRTLNTCNGENTPQNREEEIEMLPQTINDSKFADALYGPLVLLIIIASPFSVTLLPMNNVLIQPKCWYELPISTISYTVFISTIVVTVKPLLDSDFNKPTIKVILKLFMVLKTTESLAIWLIHLIWSDFLGYYEPFPYRCTLAMIPCWNLLTRSIWHLVPKQMRMDPLVRKRFKWLFLYFIWTGVTAVELLIIRSVMHRISRDFQWILALVAPLTKEVNDRILDKLQTKFVTSDNVVEARFHRKIHINLIYSFWLAISFISVADASTEYVLLAINFCTNISLCYKVIRLNGKISDGGGDVKEKMHHLKKEVLTELILNESIEVIIPVSFIGAFSLAYYGPNKNTLWIVKDVKNLPFFLAPVLKMALIDSGSLILAGVALFWYCRINILQEYCETMKKYWMYLVSFSGIFINHVSIGKLGIWH